MDESRKYGTAAVILMQLLKADGSGYADDGDWTPAAGDVKVSLSTDGLAYGSAANVATLPSYDTSALGWLFPLSSGELTAKIVSVRIVDAALSDDAFLVDTFGNASAFYPDDFSVASVPSLTASETRDAVGLATDDLDAQLAAIPAGVTAALGALVIDGTVTWEELQVGLVALASGIRTGFGTSAPAIKRQDGSTDATLGSGADGVGNVAGVTRSWS
jgi:hypothetical protein